MTSTRSRDGAAAGQLDSAVPQRGDIVDAVGAVTTALSSDVALDDLLHLIAERICVLIDVRRCSIHLREPRTGLFRGRVGHANRDIDRDVRKLIAGLPADRFTQEIVATRRPVLLTNPLADPRAIRSAMRHWQVTAVLGVPMVLLDEVIGILFLDNESEPHPYSEQDQAVAATFAELAATAVRQTQQTQQLRDSLATVARQNKLLRRASQMEDRLATRLLRGSSVAEIAGAIATLTGKACQIYDASFGVIADCHPEGSSAPLPQVLGEDILRLPVVAEVIARLGASEPTAVLGAVPSAGLHHRLLLAAIDLGPNRWGYLAIVERDTPLDPADAQLTRRAARNISVQLDATRRAAGAGWQLGQSLTNGLIGGDSDLVSLQQRADLLGVRLDTPRAVCVVRARASSDRPPSAETLVQALADPRRGRLLAASGAGESIVLLPVVPDTSPAEAIALFCRRLHDRLDELAPDGGLLAAVSPIANEISDYECAYDDAVQVSRCLEGYVQAPGNHVLSAAELGPAQLVLGAAAGERGRRFARSTLGALLTPDSPKLTELLATLLAFQTSSHSARRAAAALGVHTNTVRYRLTRIRELTGLDVADDIDAQMAARMSLLILDLGGELPADLGTFGGRTNAVPRAAPAR